MTMNRILYILPIAFLALVSCKEDTLDTYHGSDYVHFTPGLSDRPEVEYNFAMDGVTTRETEATIPVEIRLWGYLPVADFKCEVSVVKDKTTAAATDYVEPEYALFRTGYHVDTLWVKVNRREKLLASDYKIVLMLDNAGDDHVVGPAKYNTVTVKVTDQIKEEPRWWGAHESELGQYIPMKYRMLNIFLGKVLRTTDEYTNITFKEKILEFKQWWKENWESYKYYAADGSTPLYDTIPD